MRAPATLLPLFLFSTACGGEARVPADGADPAGERAAGERSTGTAGTADAAGEALRTTLGRSIALADSMEDILRPVPLMRPAEESALRQYSNAQNVAVARRLGARPGDAAELRSLVDQGRLVPLEDSTRYWVLRRLSGSRAYITPDTRALLERVGERFQARLGEMGLPPLRFEISSALRTAEAQAALRRRNVNAAAGTSAHEFGTTVDIPYSAYAAPAQLPVAIPAEAPASLRPELERVAREVVERMAARKSRELKKVLGEVLGELQSEGDVLVTLERLQPVYHITVARRIAD